LRLPPGIPDHLLPPIPRTSSVRSGDFSSLSKEDVLPASKKTFRLSNETFFQPLRSCPSSVSSVRSPRTSRTTLSSKNTSSGGFRGLPRLPARRYELPAFFRSEAYLGSPPKLLALRGDTNFQYFSETTSDISESELPVIIFVASEAYLVSLFEET
jgi:hypothetical protein